MLQLIVLIVLLNLAACASVEQVSQTKPCGLLDYIHQISISGIRRVMNQVLKIFPDYNYGPNRTHDYDPNLGYELYWANVEWESKPPKSTTGGDVCGEPCDILYEKYGPICARNKELKSMTFANYCKLREKDCNNEEGWLISYRGECVKEIRTFPTRSNLLGTRALQWQNDFYKKYPHLTTKPKNQNG